MPPSASVADAEQVSVSPTAPLLGLTPIVLIVGALLVTVAVALPTSDPPSASVAVAVQVSVSPGSSSESMVCGQNLYRTVQKVNRPLAGRIRRV